MGYLKRRWEVAQQGRGGRNGWLLTGLLVGVGVLLILLIGQVAYLVVKLILDGKLPITVGVINSGEEFEIFRDVLLVVLGLMAIIGIGAYRVLRGEIRRDLASEMQGVAVEAASYTDLVSSHIYYLLHELRPGEIKKSYAVDHARKSLTARPWAKEELERRIEHWKVLAANNLAYFLAWRHRQEPHWDDRGEALKLAGDSYRAYRGTDERLQYPEEHKEPELLETYWYVRASFAQTKEDAEEICREVKKLLESPGLKPIHEALDVTLGFLKAKFAV